MGSRKLVVVVLVLLVASERALAFIAPSFILDDCAWNASHIVVVSEGEKIDGVVEVLESWKGDLKKGDQIKVPELAVFAAEKNRVVSRRLFDDGKVVIPSHVTCSRMILFLIKKQEIAGPGVPAKVSWLPANTWWKQMDVSTVWVEKRQVYAFAQQINPGPTQLIPWEMNECEFSCQVTDILEARSELAKALSLSSPDKVAEAVLPMIRSGPEFVRKKAVEALGNTGPRTLTAIRKVLQDDKLAAYHANAISAMADAGGATVGPELTRMLKSDLAYWKATGPGLEPGWWNGGGQLPWNKVELLRERYSKSFDTISSLDKVRYAGCKMAVITFRDYWQSLPQLHEVGRGQMTEACNALIEKLHVAQDAAKDVTTRPSVREAIRQSPSSTRDWNPVMLVRAVNRLQALGRADAIVELRRFAKNSSDHDRVSLILRLLFEVDRSSEGLHLGALDLTPSKADEALWPVFPLALQDDLPFCLTGGWGMRIGRPSNPLGYLGRGPFLPLRAKPLRPADDPIAAVDKLLALPQTRRLTNSESFRAGLRRQAWLAIAPLLHGTPVHSNPEDMEFTDKDWEARKREVAKVKTYWDIEKQDYAVKQ